MAVIPLSVFFIFGFNIIKSRILNRQDTATHVQDTDVDLSSLSFSPVRSDKYTGINCYLRMDGTGLKRGNEKAGEALALCFDAFMVGLRIPQDRFWVNLSYLEPSRVLDSEIADTLTGRVLLYGDLRLKQDISQLINPAVSSEGAGFWDAIKKKARQLGVPDDVVVLNRVWIEPAEAWVYLRKGAPCILRCSLRVCLESPGKGEVSPDGIQAYVNELFTRTILPRLNKRINQDESYASLRCVYKGLVLAKAYKDSVKETGSEYLMGFKYRSSGLDLQGTRFNCSAAAIYRKYMNEIKKARSCGVQSGDLSSGITFTNYFMGGIDFRSIAVRNAVISLPPGEVEMEFRLSVDMINDTGGLFALFKEEVSSRLRLSGVLADGSFPGLTFSGVDRLSGRIKKQRANSSGL
ncbi:MAG: hypothetical protein WBE75_01060 [Candidatus Omnitrophota bacterium]